MQGVSHGVRDMLQQHQLQDVQSGVLYEMLWHVYCVPGGQLFHLHKHRVHGVQCWLLFELIDVVQTVFDWLCRVFKRHIMHIVLHGPVLLVGTIQVHHVCVSHRQLQRMYRHDQLHGLQCRLWPCDADNLCAVLDGKLQGVLEPDPVCGVLGRVLPLGAGRVLCVSRRVRLHRWQRVRDVLGRVLSRGAADVCGLQRHTC